MAIIHKHIWTGIKIKDKKHLHELRDFFVKSGLLKKEDRFLLVLNESFEYIEERNLTSYFFISYIEDRSETFFAISSNLESKDVVFDSLSEYLNSNRNALELDKLHKNARVNA